MESDNKTLIKKELIDLGNNLGELSGDDETTIMVLKFINSEITEPNKKKDISSLLKFLKENPNAKKGKVFAKVATLFM